MLGARRPSPSSSTTWRAPNWLNRVAVGVGNDRPERHPVEEVLQPAAARDRQPRRPDRQGGEAEAGVRREEHVARLDDRELLGEVDVEAVDGSRRVREQGGVLGGGERARAAPVLCEPAQEREPDVGHRGAQGVEDPARGRERGIDGALARPGRHDRDPRPAVGAAAFGHPPRSRRPRRLRHGEAQLLVTPVGGPPRPHDGAAARGGQVLVARGVLVAHPGEGLELDRLVAAEVVEHPVPLARNTSERRPRVLTRATKGCSIA
jgi:hypothetical protein